MLEVVVFGHRRFCPVSLSVSVKTRQNFRNPGAPKFLTLKGSLSRRSAPIPSEFQPYKALMNSHATDRLSEVEVDFPAEQSWMLKGPFRTTNATALNSVVLIVLLP